MEKVRYGIIGMGVQGKKYADMIYANRYENSVLSAVCTTTKEKAEKLKQEYDNVSVFTDYKDMILSKDIDAIITTCPSQFHSEIAIFAIENGVHVLNEKPAGIYSKQVSEINRAYEKNNNVSYGIVFNQRTNTIFQEIKRIIESNELGDFRRINWIQNTWYRPEEYYKSGFWRAKYKYEGGGLILNQAQHTLDLIYFMTGLPKSLYAKELIGYNRDITTDNDVSLVFEYPNGATGTYVSCTHDMFGTNRLEIDLSMGKIVVEDGDCTIYTFFADEKEVSKKYTNVECQKMKDKVVNTRVIKNENCAPDKQYDLIIENFSNNILNGEPLIAHGLDGQYSVLMSDAANLSNDYKKEVNIPVDEDEYLKFLNKKIAIENL